MRSDLAALKQALLANRRAFRPVYVVLLAAVGLVGLGMSQLVGANRLEHSVRGAPTGISPLVFIVVAALLCVVFLPTPAVAVAAGILEGGALAGTALTIATLVVSTALMVSVARRRHREEPRLPSISAGDWPLVASLRLAPGFGFAVVAYVLAGTRLTLRSILLGTGLGCIPRMAVYATAGGSIRQLDGASVILAVTILIGIGIVGAAALIWRAGRIARPSALG